MCKIELFVKLLKTINTAIEMIKRISGVEMTHQFNLNSPEKIIAILIVVIFSWFCYFYQIAFPVCCDAPTYIDLAEQYVARGLIIETSGLRLYGYPFFLAINMKLANLISVQVGVILFLTQITLYLLGVCLVSKQISRIFSTAIANVCFFSLLSNIFVYPYLTISLTDGFTVILLLFICLVILKLFSEPFPLSLNRKSVLLSIVLGFFLGFAIMVRPANISWLLLLLPVSVVWSIHCRDRWRSGGGAIFAISIGFALAVAPQIQLNLDGFSRFTFLPTRDLGGDQIRWGIGYIKYATSMVNGAAGLVYANPALHGSSETIVWYFNNPFAGLKTILLHIFSAFDFDYLFPYIYNYNPSYRFFIFSFSHLVLFWSVVGYVLAIYSMDHSPETNSQAKSIQKLLLILYTCLVFGWVTVHALSAVENRFALPIVAAMLPLSAWALFVKAKHLKSRNFLYGFFGVYLLLAWQLSAFVSSLKIV